MIFKTFTNIFYQHYSSVSLNKNQINIFYFSNKLAGQSDQSQIDRNLSLTIDWNCEDNYFTNAFTTKKKRGRKEKTKPALQHQPQGSMASKNIEVGEDEVDEDENEAEIQAERKLYRDK